MLPIASDIAARAVRSLAQSALPGAPAKPPENRILGRELRDLGCQAARSYSLMRPLRAGFRRIWLMPKSRAMTRGGWCALSGMRWSMP
jgi:hypothetical protein